jgi:hypothetical protein
MQMELLQAPKVFAQVRGTGNHKLVVLRFYLATSCRGSVATISALPPDERPMRGSLSGAYQLRLAETGGQPFQDTPRPGGEAERAHPSKTGGVDAWTSIVQKFGLKNTTTSDYLPY